MTLELLIAIVSFAVTVLATPCSVVVTLLVFRAVTQWRVAALEARVGQLEGGGETWRAEFQKVRSDINELRVELARHLPKDDQ